jgi:acetylornithine/succinyldiaminopimelate/putrescine aminotransferase
VANENFVRILRNICDEKNLLLIFDEVQTGMGRTAKMFCYQHYGVNPDILVLAKALGGGLPIGAIVAERRIADSLKAGMHASTFGGSPLVCKAALAVFKAIQNEKLLNNSKKMADYLFAQLESLAKRYSFIKEIRGKGLMIGIELEHEGKPIVEEALKQGLLINCTQDKVLRLMPPLIVTKKDIDKAIKILDRVFTQVLNKMKTQLTEKMT